MVLFTTTQNCPNVFYLVTGYTSAQWNTIQQPIQQPKGTWTALKCISLLREKPDSKLYIYIYITFWKRQDKGTEKN